MKRTWRAFLDAILAGRRVKIGSYPAEFTLPVDSDLEAAIEEAFA